MEENFEVDKTTPHEQFSERSEAIEVLETSRQESVEVVKTTFQERIAAGSQLTVPKTSCWENAEVAKHIHQERSSERMCESSDQLWHRIVEQDLNRALDSKGLRDRCEKVWPQLGGGASSFSCEH